MHDTVYRRYSDVSYVYDTDLRVGYRRAIYALEQTLDEFLMQVWMKSMSSKSFEDWKQDVMGQSKRQAEHGTSNISGADLAHL